MKSNEERGRQMTELERLKGNLDVLHKAYHLSGMSGKIYLLIDRERDIIRQRIAEIEALSEQADEWADAKAILNRWCFDRNLSGEQYRVFIYVCHLQSKVAELDHELRCERIDGGKVRDDQKAFTADRNREKLAELTAIANAIPPACGLAKELVEKRIEGVKKQLQETGAGQ